MTIKQRFLFEKARLRAFLFPDENTNDGALLLRLSPVSRLSAYFFGIKYYANIVNWNGTDRMEIASFIFPTREEAIRHAEQLSLEAFNGFAQFDVVETISFRSRLFYENLHNPAHPYHQAKS